MRRFTNAFVSFDEWLANAPPGSYRDRITRIVARLPGITLSQARGHPKKGERKVSARKAEPLSKRPSGSLSPGQRATRDRTQKALVDMRYRGKSATQAARDRGTTVDTIKRHTGALKRDGSRYRAKKWDTVPRRMAIYSNKKEIVIDVKDSRHATTIGRYMNAVQLAINSGDDSHLKPFRGKKVKDKAGGEYVLEIDLDALYEIQEIYVLEPEYYELYRHDK